jgi:hypothetical protein
MAGEPIVERRPFHEVGSQPGQALGEPRPGSLMDRAANKDVATLGITAIEESESRDGRRAIGPFGCPMY